MKTRQAGHTLRLSKLNLTERRERERGREQLRCRISPNIAKYLSSSAFDSVSISFNSVQICVL